MRIKCLRKKVILMLGLLFIALLFGFMVNNSNATTFATVKINLSDNGITVNGKAISEDSSQAVYLSRMTNNGGTSDEAKKANISIDNVVNITAAGVYEFSGSLSNGQIAVDFNKLDENTYESTGHVGIVLNNVNITCKNAPAILAYNKSIDSTGKELLIQTVNETTNTITGEKIEQIIETWSDKDDLYFYIEHDESDGARYKYDGAISSDVNLIFQGEGTLVVNGTAKEGIEGKQNISFESGKVEVNSMDDGINASTDHKSKVLINGGSLFVNVLSEAEEGDGIDSNGSIYIYGGMVFAFGSETSQDNGLDADDGIFINGGFVAATGNMADGISSESEQNYLQMYFKDRILADSLIVITDKENNALAAFKSNRAYSILTISTPELLDDNMIVYEGGDIEGSEEHGFYTQITSYSPGIKKEYSKAEDGMGPKNFEGMNRNKGKGGEKQYYIILGVLGVALIVVILFTIVSKRKKK